MDFLDQPAIHSILQNKVIHFAKQGITRDIPADTTIIDTANPKQEGTYYD